MVADNEPFGGEGRLNVGDTGGASRCIISVEVVQMADDLRCGEVSTKVKMG